MHASTRGIEALIVGAGISGIGCAYHLTHQCPRTAFAILDVQDRFGGHGDPAILISAPTVTWTPSVTGSSLEGEGQSPLALRSCGRLRAAAPINRDHM